MGLDAQQVILAEPILVEDGDASLLLWLIDQEIHHIAVLPNWIQTSKPPPKE